MKIKNKNELFNEIVHVYKTVFGDEILSVSIYGSAITENFNPKTSDINSAIILTNLQLENLVPAKNAVAKLKKKRVATPLFLSKEYIESSLDTFPIEFLNIQCNHKTIFGEDYFADLKIDKEYLRLQAERELKGKLLILRLAFIENIKNKRLTTNIIQNSITAILPVLKAILFLNDKKNPLENNEVINACEDMLQIDLQSIRQALSYKFNKMDLKGEDLVGFFEQYVGAIDSISDIVDKFEG